MNLIVYINLIPFLGLCFLLWLVLFNPTFHSKQTRIFLAVVLINMVMILAVSFDFVFAYKENTEHFWFFRRITSFLNFGASPLIPYGLLAIFNLKKKKNFFMYIPIILNFVLCFISMFVPLVFFISTENTYSRGPLFIMPFAVSLIYVAVLAVESVRCRTKSKRIESYFLMAIILALIMCFSLEIVLGYYFLDWACCAMSLMAYYVLLSIHASIVDPLTGAYNRLSYAKMLTTVDGSKRCLIAMMDINYLKQTNDQFGHNAGDALLVRFVEIITKSFGGSSGLYRIGGDEFVYLSKKLTPSEFERLLGKAREAARSHNLSFACGMVEYLPDADLQKAIKQADEIMYQDKRQIKGIPDSKQPFVQ